MILINLISIPIQYAFNVHCIGNRKEFKHFQPQVETIFRKHIFLFRLDRILKILNLFRSLKISYSKRSY